ncbi:zinc finger protein 665-like [Dendropsophus ebraccatus]|uniref:zinc finger protein 665-like n=1 Tax=Dendropsophus ebraccatus TaxID=150705 RepID=UPI0038311761
MDSCQGFEVGAEVELIEGLPVLDDSATITVENKQDLPAWHHIHYVDESSSDESLDHLLVFPTSSEVKNEETPRCLPEVKTECVDQAERKMSSVSEGLYMRPPLHVVQNNDQSGVWSDAYNIEAQDQAYSLEETEISLMDVVPASNNSPSPPRPSELYSEITLTQEEDEPELLGKYSYYNAKTQSVGTVKPWIRSHKCEKCGRQFGRMYNLERHMCIKTALTRVNMEEIVSRNMSGMNNSGNRCEQSEESMNRLEKMCAEAQKELHNLQGLYKREDEKPPSHIAGLVSDKSFKYRRPFTCDRCGRRFRSKFNLGCHVCCNDKSLSAPQNTIVIKPDNPVASDVLAQSVQTTSGQDFPPGKSESLEDTNEGKVFKCQLCGKVYTKRAYYVSHMRWHVKERELVASVNKYPPSGSLDSLLNSIDLTPVGSKKKTGTMFACQECGRIFNKQCSYSTHTLWHNKRRNAALALAMPNQEVEGQKMETPEAQVPSISAKHQQSDQTKAVPDTFVCPECGRVFFKRIAYANHSRWHVKERELALSVKAAAQANALGYPLKPSTGGSSRDLPQGYSSLVKHIDLGEQQNFYMGGETVDHPLVESGQKRTSMEVPEFIFELEVGTESFHENLASKASEVVESSGDVEDTTLRTETSSSISTTEEPSEIPAPLSQVLPYKLLGRRLKRPRPPHRCRDCGVCLSQSWKLKRHQYRRSRCKRHRCDCGRSLAGSLHFLRHQLEHLSDTAFICAVCGKALRGYKQLRAHSWVHPLVSQFQCKCGARFTQLPKYLWHSLLNKPRGRRRLKEEEHPTTR